MHYSEKQARLHHQEGKVKMHLENNTWQDLAYVLQCFHSDSSAIPSTEAVLLDSLWMNSITVWMLTQACNLRADTVWWVWFWFTWISVGPFPTLSLHVMQKELAVPFILSVKLLWVTAIPLYLMFYCLCSPYSTAAKTLAWYGSHPLFPSRYMFSSWD